MVDSTPDNPQSLQNSSQNLAVTVQRLVERFNTRFEEFRGDFTIDVGADQLVAALQTLRDEEGFEMLVDLTAVDLWPQEMPRFQVIYQLRSISHNQIISLRMALDGNEPVLPSAIGVFPNADWYERELWDMFGLYVAGHPDLRRILMPHDWVGHPLRKDYPLGYEEPQFTFNYDKIQARKLNPKE